MDVSVAWGDPRKTIVIWTLPNQWDWGEIDAALDQLGCLLDSVEHTTGMVIDGRAVSALPGDARHCLRLLHRRHYPKLEAAVLVMTAGAADTAMEALRRIFCHLVPTCYLAMTLEAAFTLARRTRRAANPFGGR